MSDEVYRAIEACEFLLCVGSINAEMFSTFKKDSYHIFVPVSSTARLLTGFDDTAYLCIKRSAREDYTTPAMRQLARDGARQSLLSPPSFNAVSVAGNEALPAHLLTIDNWIQRTGSGRSRKGPRPIQ